MLDFKKNSIYLFEIKKINNSSYPRNVKIFWSFNLIWLRWYFYLLLYFILYIFFKDYVVLVQKNFLDYAFYVLTIASVSLSRSWSGMMNFIERCVIRLKKKKMVKNWYKLFFCCCLFDSNLSRGFYIRRCKAHWLYETVK